MIKHYITKYHTEENKLIVVAWIQINIFGKCYCFSKKEIELK